MSHPLIEIAEQAVRAHLAGEPYTPPELDPPWVDARPVFVTWRGPEQELRGCIGHLQRTRGTLAEEVSETAVLAATEDPRFAPLEVYDLDEITAEISVLEPAEVVTDRSQLDPRHYGVVVRSGARRGVLLPDLDGVDTVERQLEIARKKADIQPNDPIDIERFVVTKIDHEGAHFPEAT